MDQSRELKSEQTLKIDPEQRMRAYQANEQAGNFKIEMTDMKTTKPNVQTMRNKTILHDNNIRETDMGTHNDTKVEDYST